ncbi:MAG: hypothetical protein FD127_4491, partial [Acidimicrobiaceae bacterium]
AFREAHLTDSGTYSITRSSGEAYDLNQSETSSFDQQEDANSLFSDSGHSATGTLTSTNIGGGSSTFEQSGSDGFASLESGSYHLDQRYEAEEISNEFQAHTFQLVEDSSSVFSIGRSGASQFTLVQTGNSSFAFGDPGQTSLSGVGHAASGASSDTQGSSDSFSLTQTGDSAYQTEETGSDHTLLEDRERWSTGEERVETIVLGQETQSHERLTQTGHDDYTLSRDGRNTLAHTDSGSDSLGSLAPPPARSSTAFRCAPPATTTSRTSPNSPTATRATPSSASARPTRCWTRAAMSRWR